MGFRAFLVMDNKVARQAMAENGRKWQKMGCRGKMVENGRKWIFAGKWQKMDFRVLCAIPILLIIEVMVGFRYMHGLIQVNTVNRRTLTEREAMRGMSL